jgi:aminopeptidase
MTHLPQTAIDTATKHLHDILSLAIEHHHTQAALVVSDAQCALAIALTQAYRSCLPAACFIDFDAVSPGRLSRPLICLRMVIWWC